MNTDSENKEAQRAALRRDVLNAWAEYQATGLHATGAEVLDWLQKLADGQDVAPPQCHR